MTRTHAAFGLLLALAACASEHDADPASEPTAQAATLAPNADGFPASWDDGTRCDRADDVDVVAHGTRTFIFRQSLCTHFEAPFLYLLIGDQRALLLDTGTGTADVHGPVLARLQAYAARTGKSAPELVVAHTHSHGDHVGGDRQFRDSTVVGYSPAEVSEFFGLASAPDGIATYDLGGRVLEVFAIPGHEAAHIAIYDPEERVLLTGDTLYPGRLYVQDWPRYRTSVHKLADFSERRDVKWVLGAHIEMNDQGADYAMRAPSHPHEHRLQLTTDHLRELRDAVDALGDDPRRDPHTDFIVDP